MNFAHTQSLFFDAIVGIYFQIISVAESPIVASSSSSSWWDYERDDFNLQSCNVQASLADFVFVCILYV